MKVNFAAPVAPHGSPRPFTGRSMLIAMTTFFGIVFAVNGYFMFAALKTYSGVVSVEPYRKGLAYNDRIDASERQALRGWTDTVTLERDGRLSLNILDRDQAHVHELLISATISRPSTTKFDRGILLTEQSDGTYAAAVGELEAGNWILTLEARAGNTDEPVYRSRRRLWLKS
jgi:nitrogen fixation protein FixH